MIYKINIMLCSELKLITEKKKSSREFLLTAEVKRITFSQTRLRFDLLLEAQDSRSCWPVERPEGTLLVPQISSLKFIPNSC